MTAWFKWLLKTDISEILKHRPTAFGLVLVPCVVMGLAVLSFIFASKYSAHHFLPHILVLFFPILLLYIYILSKTLGKILLSLLPGAFFGFIFGWSFYCFKGCSVGNLIGAIIFFCIGFAIGLFPVIISLLIKVLWKLEDFWFKVFGISLLSISLSPYIMLIISIIRTRGG